jgi:hypothetical protein
MEKQNTTVAEKACLYSTNMPDNATKTLDDGTYLYSLQRPQFPNHVLDIVAIPVSRPHLLFP